MKETGHSGKISHLDDNNKIHVELDSGHFISCAPFELEPEDFPHNERAATEAEKSVWKVSGGSADPFPLDFAPAPAEKYDRTACEMLLPFVEKSAGLKRALDSRIVSDHDRMLIKSSNRKHSGAPRELRSVRRN